MLKGGDKIKDGSKNIMAMGMRNQVLSLRVRKLENGGRFWWIELRIQLFLSVADQLIENKHGIPF